ncbi:spermatogenesis-associated 1-like isoform X2 [Brachionus plicatilis]|uniref:Spermatogenesis-associated 1-like isoform X2 n=1 Tax=Brachionus plicatilis TaxID=10195 RepID=A0A3M7QME2_BRAPC|nr:spermatogenesis-associated 1-like isoform X2 [Brachionus plicatilis]
MYTNRPQYNQSFELFNKQETSRPDSSKLVDLHVYILPRDFWRTKQNLAYNETIIESISAGFIRVTPHILLRDLRREIRQQCTDEEVPRDYVFLRSVGRALTRVKPYQEQELKVKYFLPPQAVGPEIFLLEVDEEISGSLLQKFDRPGMDFFTPAESNNLPTLKTRRDNGLSRNSQFYPDTSAAKESTSSISNYDRLKDLDKMKEEQERLRIRQIYLEQLRKRQMEKLSDQNGQVNVGDTYPADEDYLASRENYDSDDDDEDKDKSALIIQNAYRGYKDRQKIKRLRREKALPIIEDKSEEVAENDDVDILEVENSEESLRERIKKTRQRRIEVENLRNDLLKHIKNVHNRISIRRKEVPHFVRVPEVDYSV